MQRFTRLALVLCIVVCAGASHAQYAHGYQHDRDGGSTTRVYLGAGGLYAFLVSAEDEFESAIVDTSIDDTFGVSLLYGAQTDFGVSVEIQFDWFDPYDVDQTTALGSFSDELAMYSLTSNIGYHPMHESFFDPYVTVGGGWMYAGLDDFGASGNGIVVSVGVGVNLWVTDHIGLRLEGQYVHPVTGQIEHLETLQPRAGLLYRF